MRVIPRLTKSKEEQRTEKAPATFHYLTLLPRALHREAATRTAESVSTKLKVTWKPCFHVFLHIGRTCGISHQFTLFPLYYNICDAKWVSENIEFKIKYTWAMFWPGLYAQTVLRTRWGRHSLLQRGTKFGLYPSVPAFDVPLRTGGCTRKFIVIFTVDVTGNLNPAQSLEV